MKELLLDIIANIMDYKKVFIIKIKNETNRVKSEVKFEGRKSGLINVMYSPIFEKKNIEKNKLLCQLNNIKQESEKLNRKINAINKENAIYNKRIEALKSFQKFLLDNKY